MSYTGFNVQNCFFFFGYMPKTGFWKNDVIRKNDDIIKIIRSLIYFYFFTNQLQYGDIKVTKKTRIGDDIIYMIIQRCVSE